MRESRDNLFRAGNAADQRHTRPLRHASTQEPLWVLSCAEHRQGLKAA